MTDESERAARYERIKGDPVEWDEPERSEGPRRRLAAMFSVRLRPDELESVRTLATRRGKSVSAFLRDAALREVAAESSLVQQPAAVVTEGSSNSALTLLTPLPSSVDLAQVGTGGLVPLTRRHVEEPNPRTSVTR